MATARLTVDLGNSRAKLRLWGQAGALDQCVPLAGLELTDAADPALEDFVTCARAEHGLAGAALCAVGAPELERALDERLEALGLPPPARPDPGVENTCRDPHTTGLDRLFAARGAWVHLVAGSGAAAAGCLVVDAGTALTVDALRAPGGRSGTPARPAFLGGAIAPGPALLAAALRLCTARLPEVAPEVGAPALGRDTPAAIRAGVGAGFRGAARELCRAVAREAGLEGAPVFLTGGARRFLLEPEPFLSTPLRIDAELVHRGLLAALFDREPGCAR